MAQSLITKSGPNGPFVYIENNIANSLAFGADDANAVYTLNTSAVYNVVPDETTANIIFDPTANGNLTFRPNGSGKINALGVASGVVANKNYVTINTVTGELGSDNAPLSSISITGDTGGALTGSSFTFTGGTTGLSFGGAGSTETLTVTNFNLPATNTALTSGVITSGGSRFLHARGTDNVFLGANAGNATFTVSGSENNVIIGSNAFDAMSTNCRNNVAIGYSALGSATDTRGNVAIGYNSCLLQQTQLSNTAVGQTTLSNITTGTGSNTAIGNNALGLLVTGSYNTALGNLAGDDFTTSESSNIMIANQGTVGDNNTIRIGTQGTGNGQQNKAFMAGIVGATNAGASTVPYIETATGQLATVPGGAVTMNTGTQSISISSDASATTVNIATGAAAKTVTLGSTTTTSSLALKYGTADFTLASATGTVMSALDTGEINYPLQPAFLAIPNATLSDVTGDGTRYVIIFNTEIFDQNSDYNTGTGQFTAPVTGRYQFYGSIAYSDIGAAHTNGSQIIDTSNREYLTNLNNPTSMDISGFLAQTLVVLADMDAGDTAELVANVSGSTKTVDIFYISSTDPRSWFSGSLVC